MFDIRYLAMGVSDLVASPISILSGLAGLGILVYRLGMLRQNMADFKDSIIARLDRFEQDMNRRFQAVTDRLDAIDRRIDQVDRQFAKAAEQRVATERWLARVEAKLELHDRQIRSLPLFSGQVS